jgi:hypothetical protein
MRSTIFVVLATAVMGSAPFLAAPAQAQVAPLAPVAQTQQAEPLAAYAQYRGRYYRGGPRFARRGYYGRPYYGRPYAGRYYRRGSGGAAAAGIAGLAAGAIIGGALAQQQRAAPTYLVPNGGSAEAYCIQRFKSYDPASGTYLGYDGQRHACP